MDSTANRLSLFSFAVEHRHGEKHSDGAYKTARTYLDFVVDGSSLGKLTGSKKQDLVSFLATGFTEVEVDKAFRRLLLDQPADLPGNRRSIYVCGECGDVGCGAVTVEILDTDNGIVWRNFGYENNWENKINFSGLEQIGPFTFQKNQYRETLLGALEKLRELNSTRKDFPGSAN